MLMQDSIIHEGQLTWKDEGPYLVADLGEMWAQRTGGLPLPLGGKHSRRDLGTEACDIITEHVVTLSLTLSMTPKKDLHLQLNGGEELMKRLNEEFVQMYVNNRTIDYGPEGREGARFLKEGQQIGMIRADLDVDALEFIGSGSRYGTKTRTIGIRFSRLLRHQVMKMIFHR